MPAERRPPRAQARQASPAQSKRSPDPALIDAEELIPARARQLTLDLDGKPVKLTNLQKPFWPELGLTKGDLLRYYATVAPVLLPHLKHRAMVMKRYPNGAAGDFFFMKRVPVPHPEWLDTCSIEHNSGNVIDFPIVRDLPSLLWIVNLGCIDLNPWYARCDDVQRPDYLHFDLDPVKDPPTPFEKVREVACLVHRTLEALDMPNYVKTTGSRGFHVYVPIERGPTQKEVWTFAKQLALSLEEAEPDLVTAEYRVAKRPRGRVLVDYNQNAWGRTLASVYSPRPTALATVSTPVTWDEVEAGLKMEDFHLGNVPDRIRLVGDLWAPVHGAADRFPMNAFLDQHR